METIFSPKIMGDEVEKFRKRLTVLTFNNRRLINDLTMLAKELEQKAPEIVKLICEQIEKVIIVLFLFVPNNQSRQLKKKSRLCY